MTDKRYNIEYVRKNAIRTLIERNIKEEEAEVVIDSMLAADRSGVTTHGIRLLPSYIQKLDNGQFSIEEIEIIKSMAAFTTVDAKNIIGAISAAKCVNIAVNNAKETGVHIVFAKQCNTFGPAFYYAEKIARAGLIGFVCCNAPAAMPANNGLEAMFGTNPFAFACPSKSRGTILLDMATSIVAKSKFQTSKEAGSKLPEGWALDSNGIPTTDPVEAIKGFVLPMAGAKGYGMAMMIDLLSGFLSGAGYLKHVGKFYSPTGLPMNVGHMVVAIDPLLIYDGDFLSDMDGYIDIIRSSKAVEGKEIKIPGDRKYKARMESDHTGILIADDIAEALNQLFEIKKLPRG